MSKDKDYILGTHDEEISRLGLQHRVWLPRASDTWRRAGFTTGQTLLDVGCGPGYASVDLANIVGPNGNIISVDRSRRFLDFLEASCRQFGLENISVIEQDLDDVELPEAKADGAWVRWVFAFVKNPKPLLTRVCGSIKSGGVIALHEYFDYSTWRLAPRCPELEEFVQVVIKSWRATGGEPDIALDLPGWLSALGFELTSLRPMIDVVSPSSDVWQWPKVFLDVGIHRMVDLGHLTPERAKAIRTAVAVREADPHTLMITPGVLEIIAVKK